MIENENICIIIIASINKEQKIISLILNNGYFNSDFISVVKNLKPSRL